MHRDARFEFLQERAKTLKTTDARQTNLQTFSNDNVAEKRWREGKWCFTPQSTFRHLDPIAFDKRTDKTFLNYSE